MIDDAWHQLTPFDGMEESCVRCSWWMSLGSSQSRWKWQRLGVSGNDRVSLSGRCGPLMTASQFIIERQRTCSGIIDTLADTGAGWEKCCAEPLLEKDADGQELELARAIWTRAWAGQSHLDNVNEEVLQQSQCGGVQSGDVWLWRWIGSSRCG